MRKCVKSVEICSQLEGLSKNSQSDDHNSSTPKKYLLQVFVDESVRLSIPLGLVRRIIAVAILQC